MKKILPLRYQLTQDELEDQYPLISGILSRLWPNELEQILRDTKILVPSKQQYSATDSTIISNSKFTELFDPKYVGRDCGRCGRRVKEDHFVTDGKCSFCHYDLDGDRMIFGM